MHTKARWTIALVMLVACLAACGQAGQGLPNPPACTDPADAGCQDGPDGTDDPHGPGGPGEDPEPEPLHDTIAYVPAGGDAIRLIDPDGTNDRELWTSEVEDELEVHRVFSLEWNPQATRLAFDSTHENWCSLFNADVFVIGADGTGYGRPSQAPACAGLADFPQVTVDVPVKNVSLDSFAGFMYFQGASSIQAVGLPPGGHAVITFPSVADFGAGQQQGAMLIQGDHRVLLGGTIVDVPSSGTITTTEVNLVPPSVPWEARSPTWDHTGQHLGFIYSFNQVATLPFDPPPGAFGDLLFAEDAALPDTVNHLSRGPTAATADQVLFAGTTIFGESAIYLMAEGSSEPGDPLVSYDSTNDVLGLAWLPDASGFVFSVVESDLERQHSANMFLYEFATGDVTRLTDYDGDFVGQLTVSGDGTKVAFEFADSMDDFWQHIVDPDVYVLDLTTLKTELLVENAGAPAWSW